MNGEYDLDLVEDTSIEWFEDQPPAMRPSGSRNLQGILFNSSRLLSCRIELRWRKRYLSREEAFVCG